MNNVVGKLLVVLQLVFSVLALCFAGGVYTFHQSWRAKAVQAQTDLAARDQQIGQLKQQQSQELETREQEKVGLTTRADGAEAQVRQLTANLQNSLGELAQAQQQRDKHLADLQVAQAEADARIAETVGLRSETKKLRDTVGQQIAEIRDKEDRNLDLTGQVADAADREKSALSEISRLQDLLRLNKIDVRQVVSGTVPAEVEKINGVVIGTRLNSSRSAELVQVSIGADDLVIPGMKMVVYRGNVYKGQIQITDVSADGAIGLVTERARNGTIERGDDVTTKL